MIFSFCYNANTKIGKAARNTKFILRIVFVSRYNIFDKAKDKENIPTAQQRNANYFR